MHETLVAPSGPRSSALHAATAAAAAAVAAAAAAPGDDADGEVLSHSDSDHATTPTDIVPFTTSAAAAPSPPATTPSSNSSIAATKVTRAVELDGLEILLTERLGSLSANTANRLANIINDG